MKYYVTSKLSENIHETPEGFLVCIGVPIARTGDMIYGEGETPLETDSKGKVTIYRDEKEVFRPETMASFEGKPITIGHPTDLVTPENWSQLTKGVLQNVRRGEGEGKNDLLADLLITDSIAINLVRHGLREVSCGYEADYEQVNDGKGTQSSIVGNHLALVENGRAGSTYAINDSKGSKMKLKDKIKKIFATAQDEAMKVAEDAEAKPDEKKPEEKTGDEGAKIYDELKKMVGDISAKIDAMKPKDAAPEEKKPEEKKPEEKAKDAPVETSLEDRLKTLETAVAKLLESKAPAGDEEEEETEDDDFEESTMTGDTASKAEILAPGLKASEKEIKAAALKVAYGTEAGKKVIDALTGGKMTLDSADRVDLLFNAASEILGNARNSDFSKSKTVKDSYESSLSNKGPKSAEEINEINQKHYKRN